VPVQRGTEIARAASRDGFRFGRAPLRDCSVLQKCNETAHKRLLQQRESCQLHPSDVLHPPSLVPRRYLSSAALLRARAGCRRFCPSAHFFQRRSSSLRGPLSTCEFRAAHHAFLSANVAASAQHHPILSLSLLRAPSIHCLSAFPLAEASPSTDWYAALPRPPVSPHFSRFWLVSHPPYHLASKTAFRIRHCEPLLTLLSRRVGVSLS
jgi:hypothetical protein